MNDNYEALRDDFCDPCPHCGGSVGYSGIEDDGNVFYDVYSCESCDFTRSGPGFMIMRKEHIPQEYLSKEGDKEH